MWAFVKNTLIIMQQQNHNHRYSIKIMGYLQDLRGSSHGSTRIHQQNNKHLNKNNLFYTL